MLTGEQIKEIKERCERDSMMCNHARETVPALLVEVERLRTKNDLLRKAVEWWRRQREELAVMHNQATFERSQMRDERDDALAEVDRLRSIIAAVENLANKHDALSLIVAPAESLVTHRQVAQELRSVLSDAKQEAKQE